MVFEHIEKLKRDYTDKYVVVDPSRPELARFKEAIGLIKTVNMSGRALVEFDQYDNIGWYDIELDFLKVVPKPDPQLAAAKKEAAGKAATQKGSEKVTAPAATAKQVATTKAAAKPAVKKTAGAPAAGKMSTADILAAARAKASGAAASAKTVPLVAKSTDEPAPVTQEEAEEAVAEAAPIPEAKTSSAKAAKGSPGSKPTTVAEKIAYCRQVDTK